MVMPLLLVAIAANLLMLVLSTGNQEPRQIGPSAHCPPEEPPSCRINEIWSNCPIAVCVPKTCNDVGFPVPCPDFLPNGKCPVPPGCICREGFVRNRGGICVPMNHCPSCGGDSYAVSGCGTHCNRKCSNYNKNPPDVCTLECLYNACDCRPGLVFDEITGKCVLPSQCTLLTCNVKNEVYDPCPAPCPFRTCGIDDRLLDCVAPLRPGDSNCPPPKCRCRDGSYRDDLGQCVRWEHCPVCTGINEMYDPCPATCPPQNCDVNIALILCAVPPSLGDPECQPGCRCIDDHVRNHAGVCIPRDQCPTCPNINEVYDPCIAPCPPRRCDVDDRLIRCAAPPTVGDIDCVAGCRCDDDYYRNSFGICVTRAECPSCDGPHEFYACGGECDNECATLHERNRTNCPIINVRCNDKCYCNDGFARDVNNACIPIEDCPMPKCKGKHEVFSECIQGDCKPKTCTDIGFPVACPRIDPNNCIKGCLCEDGYVKDKNGDCIPKDQCPSCGGDSNAVSGCGVYCNNRCSDVGKEPGFCIEICYENACDCKPGYVYDNNALKCVHPDKCTPTCGADEIYSDCIQNNCNPQNCSQLGYPIDCEEVDPKYCKKGCLCKIGFVRNDKGVCIPANDCPSCGGDSNAESGCGKNCGRLCSNYMQTGVVCTLECQINGCDCNKDHVYDTNTKKCVLPKECTPVCKKNEVFSECTNGGCSRKNCSQIGRPVPCVKLDPKSCIKGCLCKEGFLREDNGECVLEKDCKPKCNKPNEYYEPCDYNCPPNSCESLDRAYACPIQEDDKCEGRCKCKPGYYRDKKGQCLTEEQCRKCQGPNEYFSCGGACDNVCATLKDRNQTNCPIVNIKCNDMCYCEEDYARAKNGTCIPIKDCTQPQCQKNERYEECPAWTCSPKECCDVGFPVACPDIPAGAKCPVKPACVCIDGFVKNGSGLCIPVNDCPSCGGDENAESGCGTNCRKRCEDIGKGPGICPFICLFNGCDCKTGYFYDNKKEKCVLPSNCTGICGKNEIYEDCTNPTCSAKKCSELGYPLNCTLEPNCTKGCICEEGYVKNSKGICIPVKQCPSCGGDENAELGCGTNCGKRCEDVGKGPKICPLICLINSCDCKAGYFYDKEKEMCVLPSNCTGICGKNEIYEDCTNPTCSAKKCSELGYPLNCTLEPNCTKGCICEEGYVKNSKGICIPVKQCPSCGGDSNAESGCGKNCGRLCSNYMQTGVVCTLECQINGCDCNKDHVYDTNTKKCVLPKECTPVCKQNEVYSDCTNGGCSRKNCSQIGLPVPCIKLDPKNCIKGCLCKEDYLREDNGECVLESDCKPRCNKPNEYYEPCAYDCPPNTCESLDRVYECPNQNKDNCKGKCKCKKGFYRNKKGECITEKQCRQCQGPNEYFSCGGACDNVCATLKDRNQTNCPIVNIKCNDMCYCEEDYARAKNGTCIPIKDCKKPQCKKNEVYSKCPALTCKPKACSDVGYPVPCPFIPAGIKCPDKPACICIDGYVKNDDGECIPVNECLSCGGDENAEIGCGTNCGKKCEDLGNKPGACPEICGINTCDCKDGYFYDKNIDKCVPASECTGICSGKNEVFDDCTNPTCRPKKCSEVGFPLNCTYVPECNKGCVCKEGYVKNSKGVCIPIKQCPSCGGDKNAQSGCGVNCLKKCYDFQNPDKPKPCPKICRVNACDCKDNYYYDENLKKCVRSKKCTPSCGKDEVFDPCINGGCTIKNCTQLGGPMPSKEPKKCIAGCSCKEGYLRSSKGVCILVEKCPKAKCKKNAKFMMCPSSFCGPRRCDQLGFPIKCPVIEDGCCPSPPGCICADDHVTNDKGICIPKRSCPSCGGDKNAWAGCGINCGKHCDDLNNKTRICPRICLENACDCRDGLYYDDITLKCVEPDYCTPPCPENEVRDSCVNGGCGYRNCSELNGPILCIDPVKCKTGCTCAKDFLRDDNTGICVHKDKCPPICPENEVYNSCVNGGCGYRNCSDLIGPELCIDPLECKGGCSCKDDYLRDDDTGVCIPKNQCPKICDKPNEVFVKCPPRCPPQTCESLNKTYFCPLIKVKINESDCVGECRCIEGFFRNLLGECISKKNCLKCTGEHNYFSCGPACDNVCCDLDKQSKVNCPIFSKKCVEKCYCEDGYARDDYDNCVLIEDCGKTTEPLCPDPINSTVAVANFQDGNTKLTIELMKEYLVTRPGENIMFSSLSLLIAMANLTLGAIGAALKQLLNFQSLQCKDEIRVVYPIIIKSLMNPRNVTFEIGNKDYADENNCPLTEQYKKDAKDVFFAEAENIDFSQNVKASDTINKWVSNRTGGLITDLVKPEMFSSQTRLAIFNVLYFLGNWRSPFDEKKTKPAKFYLNDKDSVMLPTMNQINRFEYGENDDLAAKIISLQYEGGLFKLVIFLPNEITGLKGMLEKLDVDTFKKSMNSLTFERCNVSIPLMDYETEFSDLINTLKKLGLTAPFEPSNDFRGIIQNNEPLSITDLIQKTVIKVNEKGTEAAAATGVILTGRSLPRPSTIYNFDANCPFMFFVQSAYTIVFSGAFNG